MAEEFTSENLLALSLEQPTHPLALSQRAVAQVTSNQLRHAFAQLLAGNLDNVQRWLEEVAATSPSKAIELLLQMAEFNLPRLKAMAVKIEDQSGRPARELSVAELERIISEQ